MGYEFRRSPSPWVNVVWRAHAESGGRYTDAANEFWGLSFEANASGPSAWLIGPSIEPRELEVDAGTRSWGVEFAAHVFVPGIPKPSVVGELRRLPTDGGFFELAGVRFPVTGYDDMESLVAALRAQGVIADDSAVARALAGDVAGYSERQLRRLTTAATGLGPKRLEQLRRARRAYRLLQEGVSLAEAAFAAGYSDQAHLTRAFRQLSGGTPRGVLTAAADPFSSRPVDGRNLQEG